MVDPKPDAETDSDLLWAAIAGLRADVARLVGRLERMSEVEGQDLSLAPEAAEAWKAERQKQIDALLAGRRAQGKDEELDDEDRAQLNDAWLCG